MLKKCISVTIVSITLFSCNALASEQQALPNIVAKQNSNDVQNNTSSLNNRINNIINQNTNDTVKKGDIYIPKNTKIELRLLESIHSQYTQEGSTVYFEVAKNVIINGVVVIAKGTEVHGVVVKSRKAGGFGRKGKLELNIPSVTTINDVDVPVNGYINSKGKGDGGAVAVGLAVSVIGGLFMKGSNIHYEPGQLFTVTTKEDTDLEATNDNLLQVMRRDVARGTNITVTPK